MVWIKLRALLSPGITGFNAEIPIEKGICLNLQILAQIRCYGHETRLKAYEMRRFQRISSQTSFGLAVALMP